MQGGGGAAAVRVDSAFGSEVPPGAALVQFTLLTIMRVRGLPRGSDAAAAGGHGPFKALGLPVLVSCPSVLVLFCVFMEVDQGVVGGGPRVRAAEFCVLVFSEDF